MEVDENELQCRRRWSTDLTRRLAKHTEAFERKVWPIMDAGMSLVNGQATAATRQQRMRHSTSIPYPCQENVRLDDCRMDVKPAEMFWMSESGPLQSETQCPSISAGNQRRPLEEERFEILHVVQALLKDMDLNIVAHKRDLKLVKTAQTLVREANQRPKWTREFFYPCLIQQKNDKTDVALLMALWSVIALVIYIIPCPNDLQVKVLEYIDATWKAGIPDPLFDIVTRIRDDIMYISGLDRDRMQWFCTEEFDSCCVLLPDGHHQETLYHSSTSVSDVLEQITERCELGSKASSKLILMKGETPHVLASQTLLLDILQADDYSDDSAQGRLQAKRFFASDATVGSTKLVFWSFLQARAEYLAGWYPAPDETVVQLAILLARYSLSQSSFGDETQLKENLPNFMPKQFAEKWNATIEDSEVLSDFQSAKRMSMQEIRQEFLQIIESLDYGLCIFFSPHSIQLPNLDRSLEEHAILGVNSKGLHVFAARPYRHLVSVAMESIVSFTHDQNVLTIDGRDPHLPCAIGIEEQKGMCEVLLLHKGDLPSSSPVQPEKNTGEDDNLLKRAAHQAPQQLVVFRSCPLVDSHDERDLSPIAERMKDQNSCLQAEDRAKSEDLVGLEKAGTESGASVEESANAPKIIPKLTQSLSHNQTHFASSSSSSGYQNIPEKQENLRAGSIFAEKYIIEDHMRELDNSFECHAKSFNYAWEMQSSSRAGRRVVLKFYKSTYHFQESKVRYHHLASKYFARQLEVIEIDGFLPCMVFERGDMTLNEWRERRVCDIDARRNVVHQILKCLEDLHKKSAVHCDIQSNNIEWFEAAHCWKLVNVDRAIDSGGYGTRQPPLQLLAPEWYQATENGDADFAVTPGVDMWSFGIVAFEILTGKNFYGEDPTDANIKDCLAGRQQLPGCVGLDAKTDRRYVERLLEMDPASRGSAEDCLKFLGNSGLPYFLEKRQQDMEKQLSEIKDILRKSHNEQMAANLGVDVVFQEFCSEKDILVPFDQRAVDGALTATDDSLESPVFLLNIGRDYRLRIRLWHRHTSTHDYIIKKIKIRGMDEKPEQAAELEMKQITSNEGVHTVVALFAPDLLNSAKLFEPTPQFGELIERYVGLRIHIVVGLEDTSEEDVDLKSILMCQMFVLENSLALQRLVQRFRKKYFEAPQWIRDSSGGVIILGKAAIVSVASVALGNPTMLGRAMSYLCGLFLFDCSRRKEQF